LERRSTDRRTFLKMAGVPCLTACVSSCVAGWPSLALGAGSAPAEDSRFIVEAQFYEKLPYKKTRCKLCPRECVIDDQERGYCGVRENRGGSYYTLVHSRVCAAHIDPIEKKPLFHFLSRDSGVFSSHRGLQRELQILSELGYLAIPAGAGSQHLFATPRSSPGLAQQNRCPAIAYTYSEPVVFYEYMRDAAEAGHALGIKSVVVSGGFIQQDPLKKLCQGVDAIKVDLKAFLGEVLQRGCQRRTQAGA